MPSTPRVRRLPLLVALPLALLLSGCFQVFSTLTVRPDGSAQIVERITTEGMMAMALMAIHEPPDGGPTTFEQRAASLGEGVSLASVDEEFGPGFMTYTVTYDVADVNSLAYTVSDAVDPEKAGETMMNGSMGMEDESEDEDAASPFRFAFEPASAGAPATLRVIAPEDSRIGDFSTSEMGSGEMNNEDSYKQSLVMLGTMSMHFDVAVEGETVEAERGWVEDNRVTLSSIQMGELLTYARDEIVGGDVGAFIEAQDPTTDMDLPGLRQVAPGEFTIQFR